MTLLLLFNAPASSPGGATGTAFQSFVEAGMFLGNWDIDDYITFTACTHDAGAAANADAVPSYAIYEDETAAAIVSGNMAQLGAVTGFYTERVQLTAASGFETGKMYAVRVEAVMGGVTAAAAHVFQVEAALALEATAQAILLDTGTTLPELIAAISQTVASTTDATTAGSITRRRGDSWAIQLTVGSIVGYTSLWFTARGDRDAADTASVVQVRKNASGLSDGLLYVNGAVAATAGLGSITVSDASTGAIIITVDEAVTDDLSPAEIYYDVQVLNGGNVTTPDLGTLTITADVTRAIL